MSGGAKLPLIENTDLKGFKYLRDEMHDWDAQGPKLKIVWFSYLIVFHFIWNTQIAMKKLIARLAR